MWVSASLGNHLSQVLCHLRHPGTQGAPSPFKLYEQQPVCQDSAWSALLSSRYQSFQDVDAFLLVFFLALITRPHNHWCVSPPVPPTWKPVSGTEVTTNGASLLPLLPHLKFFLQPQTKGMCSSECRRFRLSSQTSCFSQQHQRQNLGVTPWKGPGEIEEEGSVTQLCKIPALVLFRTQKMTLHVCPAFFLFLIFH